MNATRMASSSMELVSVTVDLPGQSVKKTQIRAAATASSSVEFVSVRQAIPGQSVRKAQRIAAGMESRMPMVHVYVFLCIQGLTVKPWSATGMARREVKEFANVQMDGMARIASAAVVMVKGSTPTENVSAYGVGMERTVKKPFAANMARSLMNFLAAFAISTGMEGFATSIV